MGSTPDLKEVCASVKTLYFGYVTDDMSETEDTSYERVPIDDFFDTSSPVELVCTRQSIQFPEATGNQGVIRFVAAWNKPTGGVMLFRWNIPPTKISSGIRLVAPIPTGWTIRIE